MTPNWQSFLQSAKASFDDSGAEPLHFGDPAGELQACPAQTVLVPLTHLALIEASGDDARSFLHSQLTSDVNHLADGQAQHAGWCNAKGRMQASFIVWRNGDRYRLMFAADLLEATLKRLQMFVLRAKVRLTVQPDILLGLAGTSSATALTAAALPVPEAPLTCVPFDGVDILNLDNGRFIIASSEENAPALWHKLASGSRPAGLPVWRWLDIAGAFPLVTLATKEEFVPQMADFEKIGGVSFHKGCYPGQEIVARTQYLGKVKRHLFRLRGEQPMAAGQSLYSPDNPDQAVGMVMSAAPAPTGGFAALAVVQSGFADNLRLESREGPVVEALAVNPA